MANVTDERVLSEAEAESLPIDVETLTATIDHVLGMSLSTSRREDIEARTGQLTGFLALLKGQRLGEDDDQEVLKVLRLVDRHLALSNRPSSRSQAHEAFNYMQDAAVFTKALLSAYMRTNGIAAP